MEQVIELLDRVPGGVLIGIFLLLVFGPPAIFSKTAAEKFGAFGAVARWWRNRPLQRIEQQEKETAAEVAVLINRVKTLEQHIKDLQESQKKERREWQRAAAEDRVAWRHALDSAESEIEKVRRGIRLRDQSVFELYDWTIRARVTAINGGVTLPPIPENSFLTVPPPPEPEEDHPEQE